MIAVKEAKQLLLNFAHRGTKSLSPRNQLVPMTESLGRITAAPICSTIAMPLFDNSAMDGFALCCLDTQNASSEQPVTLAITSEIRAGDPPTKLGPPHTTIRIMTGAAIPEGANAVVKKEDVVEKNKCIELIKPVVSGTHIRKQGEDFKEGDTVLDIGKRITPGLIGLLASMGIKNVPVMAQPRIAIITTGHELVSAVSLLTPGKILESNGPMLKAALHEIGLHPWLAGITDDQPQVLRQHLAETLENADVILITGGVSVGDYDFTRPVLEQLGITPLFWGVAQKPGKPLFAGTLADKLVFGLPGNPYAVFVATYLFIRPVLLTLMGHPHPELRSEQVKLSRPFEKKDNRTHFLKGRVHRQNGFYEAEVLRGQGSHLLGSLTDANCLIEIPAEANQLMAGEFVTVHYLP